MNKGVLTTAVVLLFFAGLTIFVFARPVSAKNATGTIRAKHHKPEGVTWQYPVPTGGRGFNTGTPIRTAEAVILEIDVPGWNNPARALVSLAVGEKLQIGQAMELEFIERRFIFWKRRYVTRIAPLKP